MKLNTTARLTICSLLVIASLAISARGKGIEVLTWSRLAELPPIQGQAIQPGLAGPFCGIHNDALIIAGRANFSPPVKSLWDQFMKILGLFGGSMCGLFCLGIFTKRANGPGAIIGALAGAAGLFFVQRYTNVHLLLYPFVGITHAVCAVISQAQHFRVIESPLGI